MLNSNILITGASGYIGSCAYFFLKEKYKLHVVDKNKNHYFKVNQCDLLNKDKLNNLLSRLKPKLIIHLAAQSLVDETINKKKYYKNNVLATKNLIELIKKNSINNIYPTHLKIDIDGQEFGALKGAENNLKGSVLKEIFIEIINEDCLKVTDYIKSFGFKVVWHNKKTQNQEFIFKR